MPQSRVSEIFLAVDNPEPGRRGQAARRPADRPDPRRRQFRRRRAAILAIADRRRGRRSSAGSPPNELPPGARRAPSTKMKPGRDVLPDPHRRRLLPALSPGAPRARPAQPRRHRAVAGAGRLRRSADRDRRGAAARRRTRRSRSATAPRAAASWPSSAASARRSRRARSRRSRRRELPAQVRQVALGLGVAEASKPMADPRRRRRHHGVRAQRGAGRSADARRAHRAARRAHGSTRWRAAICATCGAAPMWTFADDRAAGADHGRAGGDRRRDHAAGLAAPRATEALPPFFVLDDPERLERLAGRARLGGAAASRSPRPTRRRRSFREALPVLPVALPHPVAAGRPDPANAPAVIARDRTGGRAGRRRPRRGARHQSDPEGDALRRRLPPSRPHRIPRRAGRAAPRPVMMLACPELRVVPVTIHLALRAGASSALSTDEIVAAGRIAAAGAAPRFRHRRAARSPSPGSIRMPARAARSAARRSRSSRRRSRRCARAGIDARGPLPRRHDVPCRRRGDATTRRCACITTRR